MTRRYKALLENSPVALPAVAHHVTVRRWMEMGRAGIMVTVMYGRQMFIGKENIGEIGWSVVARLEWCVMAKKRGRAVTRIIMAGTLEQAIEYIYAEVTALKWWPPGFKTDLKE